MQKILPTTLLTAMLALAACNQTPTTDASSNNDGFKIVSGEVLVKYAPGAHLPAGIAQKISGEGWGTLALIKVTPGQEQTVAKQFANQSGIEYSEANFWVANGGPASQSLKTLGFDGLQTQSPPGVLPNPSDRYFEEVPPGDAFKAKSAGPYSSDAITGVASAAIVIGEQTNPTKVVIAADGSIKITAQIADQKLVGTGTEATDGTITGPFTMTPSNNAGIWTAVPTGATKVVNQQTGKGLLKTTYSFVADIKTGPAANTKIEGAFLLNFAGNFVIEYTNVPYLWGIHRIRAPEAWAAGATGKGIVIAGLDEGIDLTHPDIAANLWTNPNPQSVTCPGLHGYDFVDDDQDPTDTGGHGTHTAGTFAAPANGIGVVGVAPEAKIMALRGLGYFGGSNYMLVRGLKYAADCGASVVNNSWGGAGHSKAFLDILKYGTAKGTTYVFSAGNSYLGGNPTSSPANASQEISGVIGVGATSADNRRTGFSSTGDFVTVAAPGNAILSTIPQEQGNANDAYAFLQGTSMAGPHVTGVVALLYSVNPKITPAQVRIALETTANNKLTGQLAKPDYRTNQPGWYGHGLVDAKAAVDYVKANYPSTP